MLCDTSYCSFCSANPVQLLYHSHHSKRGQTKSSPTHTNLVKNRHWQMGVGIWLKNTFEIKIMMHTTLSTQSRHLLLVHDVKYGYRGMVSSTDPHVLLSRSKKFGNRFNGRISFNDCDVISSELWNICVPIQFDSDLGKELIKQKWNTN